MSKKPSLVKALAMMASAGLLIAGCNKSEKKQHSYEDKGSSSDLGTGGIDTSGLGAGGSGALSDTFVESESVIIGTEGSESGKGTGGTGTDSAKRESDTSDSIKKGVGGSAEPDSAKADKGVPDSATGPGNPSGAGGTGTGGFGEDKGTNSEAGAGDPSTPETY